MADGFDQIISDQCIGADGDTVWKQGWAGGTSSICSVYYNNIIFTQPDGGKGYNPNVITRSRTEFSSAFQLLLFNQRDLRGIGDLRIPGTEFYTDTQADMLASCIRTPGLCDLAFSNYCPSKTRFEISTNSQFLAFCGCRAPEDPNSMLDIRPQECDPLCTRVGTIPLQNPSTGLSLECESNICVINDISIQATQTSVGSVNFSQLCTGCTEISPCKCIVSDINLSENVLLNADVGTNLQKSCGDNSLCLVLSDTTGVLEPVDCSTVFENLGGTSEEQGV